MAHLTAVNHSVAELRNVIGRLAGAGIRNVLAVRGDPPGDPMGEWVRHPEGVLYAEDLVRLLARVRRLQRRAWPRSRTSTPARPTSRATPRNFIRKCRAGADFAITQMFFDADDYLRLRDRVAAAGCDTPDRARRDAGDPDGDHRALRRSSPARRSRPRCCARFERVADDEAAVRALGIELCSEMCARLLDEGVPGIHFITLNRSTATREVWQHAGAADTPAAA